MFASPYVSIVVCGASMTCATALMNPNSVQTGVRVEFTAAARRLAIFLHHSKRLRFDIDSTRHAFYVHLLRNWTSYQATVLLKKPLEYIAFSDGLGYLGRLHAALYEMKALLDLLARLTVRLVASRSAPNGFNKGKVGDIELSGGRLINWLAGHKVEQLASRDAMVALLTSASRDWITEAVRLRDQLSHYQDIPGLLHMRVSVTNGPVDLREIDILPPELPQGVAIDSYTMGLQEDVCTLTSAWLLLLPGVSSEFNEPWPRAARYLSEGET